MILIKLTIVHVLWKQFPSNRKSLKVLHNVWKHTGCDENYKLILCWVSGYGSWLQTQHLCCQHYLKSLCSCHAHLQKNKNKNDVQQKSHAFRQWWFLFQEQQLWITPDSFSYFTKYFKVIYLFIYFFFLDSMPLRIFVKSLMYVLHTCRWYKILIKKVYF
jgi:hypothetical protein